MATRSDPRERRTVVRVRWIDAHLDNLRRTAECMAVGLLWTAFSIPIVTSGAAWIAAATIFDAWAHGEEPPLFATFVAAVRRQLVPGLFAQIAVVAIAAVGYFDVRFAGAARVPGARIEMIAVALVAATSIAVIQLAVARGAHTGQRPRDAVRDAWAIVRSAPWTVLVVIMGTAICVGLVMLVPAFIVFMAGPLGYAVSAVYARASAQAERDWPAGSDQ